MPTSFRLSPPNEIKLNKLASELNMGKVDIVNLLIEAADAVEIRAMETERAKLGRPAPRKVTVVRRATWEVRP